MSRGPGKSAGATVAGGREPEPAQAAAPGQEAPLGSGPIGLGPAGWAGTAVLVAVLSMISAVMAPYPFTGPGVDARQRDMAFGLAMTLVAVGWWRRARSGGPVLSFIAATAVIAAVQFALSWVVGYGLGSGLGVAWWVEKVTSVVMLALCLGACAAAALHGAGDRASDGAGAGSQA